MGTLYTVDLYWIHSATVENSMEFSQETNKKIELSYDPTVLLLAIYAQKKTKNTNLKRYMHPSIHISIIHSCQDMEAT